MRSTRDGDGNQREEDATEMPMELSDPPQTEPKNNPLMIMGLKGVVGLRVVGRIYELVDKRSRNLVRGWSVRPRMGLVLHFLYEPCSAALLSS